MAEWQAERVGRCIWHVREGERLIARLEIPWDGDGDRLAREAQAMAAAPGLVLACKELLAAYEDGVPQCHCDRSEGHMAPAPCTSCRAKDALKAAEGGVS
jgi:hypothetical protein